MTGLYAQMLFGESFEEPQAAALEGQLFCPIGAAHGTVPPRQTAALAPASGKNGFSRWAASTCT